MATPLKPCPTPEKQAHRTRAEALQSFVTSRTVVAHSAYLCCCGRWHIATKKFWQGGRMRNIPDR